jgi:hypothetical protein
MSLAGKMGVYDVPETIRSRSIVIPMQRRLPEDKDKIERWNLREPRPRPSRSAGCCGAGPNSSTATPSTTWTRIAPVLPNCIEDRDADCWEPLLAVAVGLPLRGAGQS